MALAESVAARLRKYGFKCKTISDKQTKKKCLIAQIGKKPILAFSGHLDTVNATERMEYSTTKISYR